jgi:hypothetical protein
VFQFDCDGLACRAQFSFFADGEPAELFLDVGKVGSAASIAAHDGAISASLAMQFGVDSQTLAHALQRLRDGRAAGPIGKAFDLLEGRTR